MRSVLSHTTGTMAQQTVLEEELDPTYEPTDSGNALHYYSLGAWSSTCVGCGISALANI